MRFDVEIGPGGTVKLRGRLDAESADGALAALDTVKESVTVDCSELEYISSAGIEVLIRTYKRLNDSGRSLRLVNTVPRVRNVFTYAGLDRILKLE